MILTPYLFSDSYKHKKSTGKVAHFVGDRSEPKSFNLSKKACRKIPTGLYLKGT